MVACLSRAAHAFFPPSIVVTDEADRMALNLQGHKMPRQPRSLAACKSCCRVRVGLSLAQKALPMGPVATWFQRLAMFRQLHTGVTCAPFSAEPAWNKLCTDESCSAMSPNTSTRLQVCDAQSMACVRRLQHSSACDVLLSSTQKFISAHCCCRSLIILHVWCLFLAVTPWVPHVPGLITLQLTGGCSSK